MINSCFGSFPMVLVFVFSLDWLSSYSISKWLPFNETLCMNVTANLRNQIFLGIPNPFRESGIGLVQRFRGISMHFSDSPNFLNGLGIPRNIWFRNFAVTYTACTMRAYVSLKHNQSPNINITL